MNDKYKVHYKETDDVYVLSVDEILMELNQGGSAKYDESNWKDALKTGNYPIDIYGEA